MAEARKVLVIDDEQVVCNSCRRVLEQEGYDVSVATDPHEGINRVSEEHFDVAIVDVRMPGMGGMDVLRLVRTNRPDTQVIIITGYSSVPTAVEARQLGAADYLPKPFTPQELSDRMKRVFGAAERTPPPRTEKDGVSPPRASFAGVEEAGSGLTAEARVLLAGSNSEQMVSICRSLFSEPWEVITAETHEEVIERTKAGQADVLIIGLDVFGVQASDLINEMRKWGCRIPILVASAGSSIEVAQKLREIGIFYHLVEPFDPSEIKSVVQAAVQKVIGLRARGRRKVTKSTFVRSVRTLARDGTKVAFVALGEGLDENGGLYRHFMGELRQRCVPLQIHLAGGVATAKEFPRYMEQDQRVVILVQCSNGNGANGASSGTACYTAAEFEEVGSELLKESLKSVAYPEVLRWLDAQGIAPEVKIVSLPEQGIGSGEVRRVAETIIRAGLS
jgi:DNA-binding response OmpR family regulator